MATKKRIAVVGGSFNPPHRGHEFIIEGVAQSGLFDGIVVIPCGYRDDEKSSLRYVDPLSRATMCRMAFGHIPGVEVDTSDLERGSGFTTTWDLEQRFAPDVEVWHVLGADAFASRGDSGDPGIFNWHKGRELFQSSRFFIFPREGYPLPPSNLPPHRMIAEVSPSGASSTEVRHAIYSGKSVGDLLAPRVMDYVRAHGLYLPGQAPLSNPFSGPLVPMVIPDPFRPDTIELAREIESMMGGEPNCIVVLGGDGTMMHAIRDHWPKCLPFLGLNYGHVGHFMNQCGKGDDPIAMLRSNDWLVRQFPLLDVRWGQEDGELRQALAVNEAVIRLSSPDYGPSQSAHLKLIVDREVRIEEISGDGILVASPMGSTAYAYNLRATPLFNPGLVVSGIALDRSFHWTPVHERSDALVRIEGLDLEKRPVVVSLDGIAQGRVRWMEVTSSPVAGYQVVFNSQSDLRQKKRRFQYPMR